MYFPLSHIPTWLLQFKICDNFIRVFDKLNIFCSMNKNDVFSTFQHSFLTITLHNLWTTVQVIGPFAKEQKVILIFCRV